jgi:hypothetical protein
LIRDRLRAVFLFAGIKLSSALALRAQLDDKVIRHLVTPINTVLAPDRRRIDRGRAQPVRVCSLKIFHVERRK